ncbi:uncharacterized protein FTJAE_7608 [Fusarium tjaetaba]|uniref:Uncharacterized protein n=1 Tax=Fusarium tjaetaba TaxID=1567544 RepID=A0A8H5RCN3_9HYPO|nr:uncharacterized protein FTJAE_7608 [Fusarium tjaetaba]KAF5632276.1 hypothetical protein FTJAE_7608 [Fusarium tjaetaba]
MSTTSTTKKSSKRDEYTSHACTECQRRKVKVSLTHSIGMITSVLMLHRSVLDNHHATTVSAEVLNAAIKILQMDLARGSERKRHQIQITIKKTRSSLVKCVLLCVRRDSTPQGAASTTATRPGYSSHNTPPQTGSLAFSPDEPLNQSIEVFEPQIVVDNLGEESPSSCQDEVTYAETDTFVPGNKWLNRFAVASQICDLRSSVGADPVLPNTPPAKIFTVLLPCPRDLTQAMKIGLAEIDCLFPSIHGTRLVEAISRTLEALCYSSTTHTVVVTEQHHLIISILLVIIAAGQFLDDRTGPHIYLDKAWPGSEAYWQSRKLIQHFEAADILRRLSLHLRGVSPSSRAVTSCLDTRAQRASFRYPLALWVHLDFLDKRNPQKCGIPYFVGNSLGVVDFEHETNPHINMKDKAYLKTMFSHARLWASVWDGFLAPNAPLASDWVEIQAFDAKLLAFREQYPAFNHGTGSQWTTPFSNLLQRQKINGGFLFSWISIESLDAMGHYLDNWGANPRGGYILTSSLVESIYYITLGHREGVSIIDPEPFSLALRRARNMLESLSATIMSAARAFKALQCVLDFNSHDSRPDYDLLFPLESFPESNFTFEMPLGPVDYPSSTETFDFSKTFDGIIPDSMAGSNVEVSSALAEIFSEIEAR